MNLAQKMLWRVSVYTTPGEELYQTVGTERIGFMQSRINKSQIRHEKGSDT